MRSKRRKFSVGESLEFRRDVEVRAGVDQKNSGIYKIGLAFVLAGAQRRNQAAGSGQQNAGTSETKYLRDSRS